MAERAPYEVHVALRVWAQDGDAARDEVVEHFDTQQSSPLIVDADVYRVEPAEYNWIEVE